MKLRHQIFLLVATPVLCEIVSIVLLTSASRGVEHAGREELNAKRILTMSKETSGLLGVRIVKLTQAQYLPTKQTDAGGIIGENLKELRSLTQDNEQAAHVVERMDKSVHRLLKFMDDLGQAHIPGSKSMYFAQFLDSQDYVESAALAFNELRTQTAELESIYLPLSREFGPSATRARQVMTYTIIFVVLTNAVMIIALMYSLNASSLKRLQLLMNNIRSFSDGKLGSTRLTGNDELAELDETFAQVSAERLRLEEIRQAMTSMVSHDLRSPLTAMSLTLDFMVEAQGPELPPSAVKRLKQLRGVAERLRRLSNTLLDVARLESGKLDVDLDVVAIDAIIEPASIALESLIESANLKLEMHLEDELSLYCDCDRAVQVLVNLISNAIKFAPEHTAIKLVARRTPGGVRIEVQDRGPGIPPEQQSLLFNKFSQLSQPDEVKKMGSGLGLYICKILITAQNGTIGVEPNPDGGACFWFELPAGVTTSPDKT